MKMECDNCGHHIIKEKDEWKHKPHLSSAFRNGGCEWNCDCTNPKQPKQNPIAKLWIRRNDSNAKRNEICNY